MAATSQSLLDRLRRAPTGPDWRRLHDLYAPLIRKWLFAVPGLHDEADDLSQEVMVVVVRELGRFDRAREGSFRRWLRVVTANRVRSYRRDRARRPADPATDTFLDQLADPAGALADHWDRDHDRHVVGRLLELVRPDFTAVTWAAFQGFAIAGRPAADVARELDLTVNAVILAKLRVLKRLRQEAGELID